MEKNTILAVILSTIVLVVFFAIQNAGKQTRQAAAAQIEQEQSAAPAVTAVDTPEQAEPIAIEPVRPEEPQLLQLIEESVPQIVEHVTVETNTITAVLTNAGGDMGCFFCNSKCR